MEIVKIFDDFRSASNYARQLMVQQKVQIRVLPSPDSEGRWVVRMESKEIQRRNLTRKT